MPAQRKNTRKKVTSGTQSTPSLNLVLKRLDKFDQRFDTLDQKIDTVDRKVDTIEQATAAELKSVREGIVQGRQENAAEFKAVRGEMAQGFAGMEQRNEAEFKSVREEIAQTRQENAAEFKAVRDEMAQGFDSQRQEFKTELQREFEEYGAKTHPLYTKLENKVDALDQKFSTALTQLLTGMDAMAKNYEQFGHDRAIIDAEHQGLKKDVETLKKRDMEKAAAIEKIEKQIKAA